MSTVERQSSRETHRVFNQPQPLEDYNSFDADRPLVEALRREGAEWAETRAQELGAICGSRQTIRWGFEANEKRPQLRTHDRYGNRVDEVEFDSSWHELMTIGVDQRAARLALAGTGPRRPRRARRDVHAADAGGERGRLPDLDDLLGDPGAANAARARRGMGAALPLARLRRALAPGRPQAGRALRDGDDREAGRLRRAREHDDRDAGQRRRAWRRVRARRPQVVLLGADVRRLPGPRPGRRRHLLLPAAALDPRRRAQRLPRPAAQGQARQPLECVQRGRVPRRLGAHGRRGGPRRADDHRDGQPHPPRLRDRRAPAAIAPASHRRSTTPPAAPPSAAS